MDAWGVHFFSGVVSGTCFLLCLILSVTYASRFKTEFHSLPDCGRNFKQEQNVTETLNDISVFNCTRQCTRTSGCSGFNFCHVTGNSTCELLGYVVDVPMIQCKDLVRQPGCIYYQRKGCFNGGRYDVGMESCACAMGFKGPYCEEHWTDCIDGYSLTGDGIYAYVAIRPRPDGPTFTVLCKGDRAIIADRNRYVTAFSTDRTWRDFRNGFFRSARAYIYSNFWIGLEGMHLLTVTRNYRLVIHAKPRDSSVVYRDWYLNVRIENETENYMLRYSQYTSSTTLSADNGIEGTTGNDSSRNQPFCTLDRDCGECAKNSNSAWWFNVECSYVNPLGLLDDFMWPINGSKVAL